MIELGKVQTLKVVREKDFGLYLSENAGDENAVLLPRKQAPEGIKTGDPVEVFIYRDSEDRLIATTAKPLITVGELAVLRVRETASIGAFLDMGLEKDLLLPFREQNHKVKAGEDCLVTLYVDKSGRLAATMRVYHLLETGADLGPGDWAEARVLDISPEMGAFVAVKDRYYGLIPKRELYTECQPGDLLKARVTSVREDGKLILSLREKSYLMMDKDAEVIWEAIEESGGSLPFNDRVSPEVINDRFHLSKNAFKRAVGRLLKQGKIKITDDGIEAVRDNTGKTGKDKGGQR